MNNSIRMKNLMGIKNTDMYVLEELTEARISFSNDKLVNTGGISSVFGTILPWTFIRGPDYWEAIAKKGDGFPLDIATELHNKEYPIKSQRQPNIYGGVICVARQGDLTLPEIFAKHYDQDNLELIIDPNGKDKETLQKIAENNPLIKEEMKRLRFVSSLDGISYRSVVEKYSIYSMEGLREFANYAKKLI